MNMNGTKYHRIEMFGNGLFMTANRGYVPTDVDFAKSFGPLVEVWDMNEIYEIKKFEEDVLYLVDVCVDKIKIGSEKVKIFVKDTPKKEEYYKTLIASIGLQKEIVYENFENTKEILNFVEETKSQRKLPEKWNIFLNENLLKDETLRYMVASRS